MRPLRIGLCAAIAPALAACVTGGYAPAATPVGPFQECVAQARLRAEGVRLTRRDVQEARLAREQAAAFVSTLASQVNPIAAARAGSPAGVYVGAAGLVTFKKARYSAEAQGWYQQLNGADPVKASLLLARADRRAFRKRADARDDDGLAEAIGLLGLAERGVVSLTAEDHACAAAFLTAADRLNEAEIATRRRTLEGYERVMLRNLRAVAYLLDGDERARNVTQAARDLQAAERARYDAEIEDAWRRARSGSGARAVTGRNSVFQQVQQAFEDNPNTRGDALIAARVTTPYVNPLADYLSAVVSEIEASKGVGRRDEWDLAANAWTNAAQLAPASRFLADAADDARARARATAASNDDTKLVHVLVGIGAAPYKHVATIAVPADKVNTFPVMIPVMKPAPSALSGGRVAAGEIEARLELVSDVEGMAIRHNQDERPAQLLSAVARGFGVYSARRACYEAVEEYGPLAQFAASAACGVTAQSALTPRTDSWMALPKGYYAARLVVPAATEAVTVSMLDARRRVARSARFPLLPTDTTFIYVSAKDHALYGEAQRAPFGERPAAAPPAPAPHAGDARAVGRAGSTIGPRGE